MNRLEKALSAAWASSVQFQRSGLPQDAAAAAEELDALIHAINESGVIQDAARWQIQMGEIERISGVPRERYIQAFDAVAAMQPRGDK